MFRRLRSPRFTVVILFAIIAAVSGSILTVAAGASSRSAAMDTVGGYFGDNLTAQSAALKTPRLSWFIRRSTDGGLTSIQFGANGDIPVPGDYDGDGRTDTAVFRNGTWFLNRTTAGFASQAFGLNGDMPVPAAYNP